MQLFSNQILISAAIRYMQLVIWNLNSTLATVLIKRFDFSIKFLKNQISITAGILLFLIAVSVPLNAQTMENKKFFEFGIIQYAENVVFSLKNFLLPTETARISVHKKNTVTGKKGSRFHIPEYAFQDPNGNLVRGNVGIVIQEIIDPVDFLISGVHLEYKENGKTEYFQSAGMFRIQAFQNNSELKLAPEKKIIVEFPDLSRGESFNVYKMNSRNEWILDRENSDKTSLRNTEERSPFNYINPEIYEVQAVPGEFFNEAPAGGSQPASFDEDSGFVLPRIAAIDGMNWWNFDSPYPHVACLKGTISDPDKILSEYYTIYTIGITYKGAFNRTLKNKNNEFKINAHKNKKSKIIIMDQKGNIGVSGVISAGNQNGFDKYPEGPDNFCQASGEIVIKKLDKDLLNDRKKLSEYLSLPEEVYKFN